MMMRFKKTMAKLLTSYRLKTSRNSAKVSTCRINGTDFFCKKSRELISATKMIRVTLTVTAVTKVSHL